VPIIFGSPALASQVPDLAFTEVDSERVRSDIRSVRDMLGEVANADPRALIDHLVGSSALALTIFRTGKIPDPSKGKYQPLTVEPIARALDNPDFPAAALGRLAVVVSLLGRGVVEGCWRLVPDTSGDSGVPLVESSHQASRVFLVRDARASSQLEIENLVEPDDDTALVLQADAAQPSATRSPRSHYGRTGRTGARWVDLEALCATVSTADELFEAFRLECVL